MTLATKDKEERDTLLPEGPTTMREKKEEAYEQAA